MFRRAAADCASTVLIGRDGAPLLGGREFSAVECAEAALDLDGLLGTPPWWIPLAVFIDRRRAGRS